MFIASNDKYWLQGEIMFTRYHPAFKLAFVTEANQLLSEAKNQLALYEEFDINYALKTLSNMEKVAGYLVKTQLKNDGDLDRFEQFINLVKTAVPNLTQVFDRMKLDTTNITTLNQRHQVFNRT
jgi:hypothetical protein